MNILKKLTLESIKKNKKRSIGTIMGIIMSTALICAVAGMFSSLQATLVNGAISNTGYYHIELEKIDLEKLNQIKLNKDIDKIMTTYELGYSEFEHDKTDEYFSYIHVLSINEQDFKDLKYQLNKGHFPQNNNEIIVSERVLKKSNYKIGDEIELNIGKRKTMDGYDLDASNPVHKELEYIENPTLKKYKIVGSTSKYSTNHLFYAFTTEENGDTISAYLSLKEPNNYKTSITELLGAKSYNDVSRRKLDLDFDYKINGELLRWETLSFSQDTTAMIITVFSIVVGIIVITSVFCIRNSFAISVVEKMKMYGMLASVGATKKQIKKSVIYEGTILGLIGIPIGIICGVLADFILVKIINHFLASSFFGSAEGMVFVMSWLPIIIAIILGFVTIYLSSITSAIKASKVSPIENLKNTKDIKLNSKKLKNPKWISAIFKTGGELAYKNLKRSKKKYRTTVISLTVSIFVFITMNGFINEAFNQSDLYYTDFDYNIIIRSGVENNEKSIENIRSLDNVDNLYVLYSYKNYSMKVYDMSKVKSYDDEPRQFIEDEKGKLYASPSIIGFDDKTFKAYVNKLGLSYEDCKDKAILYDTFYYESLNDNKSKYLRRYDYKKGDTMELFNNDTSLNITVGDISDTAPFGFENSYYEDGIIVLNKKYHSEIDLELGNILIDSSNADALETDLKKLNDDIELMNYDEEAKNQRGYVIVISIFLYGFITVISLIGVTNIFNTITSNMELRSKEFAILKSIGMTKKEFNRMVNLETLFYSTKALLYGIILGLLGTILIHKAFGVKNELMLEIPYTAIIISIVFVFIIVGIIMKYSISKINKQNTIETIRNENI